MPSTPDSDWLLVRDDGITKLNATTISICSVLVIIGLVFVFAGKRIIKFLLVLLGFLFFAALTILIASKIVNFENINQTQIIAILASSAVIGILGGLLSWCLYQLGIFILGFLMGYNIGGFILQFIKLDNQWARLGIMIGCGLAIAILAIVLINWMIVIATSFIGSQSAMAGIDVIVNKGYIDFLNVTAALKNVSMTTTLWAMLASSLALMLIGILVQFKAYNRDQYYRIDEQPKYKK